MRIRTAVVLVHDRRFCLIPRDTTVCLALRYYRLEQRDRLVALRMAMRRREAGANPAVLRWARESIGLSVEQVAERMGRKADDISSWESGEAAPTFPQLEKLAYSVFKRPVAMFFFDAPPEEETPREAFRTLPQFLLENLAADTWYGIREGRAFQASLRELHNGQNPSTAPLFREVAPDAVRHGRPEALARLAREHLKVDVDKEIRWKKPSEALTAWRRAVEDAGVYVFKRSFKQKQIVGFCLLDAHFPIIMLNNGHAKSRQIFTLFHELGHVLLGISDLTLESTSPVTNKQDSRYWRIEAFCNTFAAEVLVPHDELEHEVRAGGATSAQIPNLARQFAVSREVIARRFLNRDWISPEEYEEVAARSRDDYERSQQGQGGGNYYNTQMAYLGDTYLGTAFSAFHQGRATLDQVATYLGVKPKSVPGLEEAWLRKAGSQ